MAVYVVTFANGQTERIAAPSDKAVRQRVQPYLAHANTRIRRIARRCPCEERKTAWKAAR